MERNVFDNPALYSQYLTFSGHRVNESGTTPSIYITEIKLKKTIKEMSVADMNEIIKPKEPLMQFGSDRQKELLLNKVEALQDWQLLAGLKILTEVGRIECVSFISKCRRTDKENTNHLKLKI